MAISNKVKTLIEDFIDADTVKAVDVFTGTTQNNDSDVEKIAAMFGFAGSFEEGKTPMIITGSWKINEFKKSKLNFGVTTLPSFPGQKTPGISFSGVRLAFVSSYTNYPEEAMEFAKFITSKEMLQKRFEMTDQIPPRNDIPVTDVYSKAVVEQLKYAKIMPTITQLGTFWQVMGPAVSGIWEGDDVAKTLDIAARQMEAVK